MMKLSQIDSAIKALKELRRERLAYDKKRDKEASMSSGTHTERQRNKLFVDLNWHAMHIDKLSHYAHIAVVESGLAEPFNDDYYCEQTYNPDGWHEYTFTRKRPNSN